MMFPEVTTSEWIRQNRGLRSSSVTCIGCGGNVPLLRPYISKDYIGLYTEACPHCGKLLHARNFLPNSEQARARMERAGVISICDI
jgi:hypothetical protein